QLFMKAEPGIYEWLGRVCSRQQLHSRFVQVTGAFEAEIAARRHRVCGSEGTCSTHPTTLDNAGNVLRPFWMGSRAVERMHRGLVDDESRRNPGVVTRK